jgi:hypothetical protein
VNPKSSLRLRLTLRARASAEPTAREVGERNAQWMKNVSGLLPMQFDRSYSSKPRCSIDVDISAAASIPDR